MQGSSLFQELHKLKPDLAKKLLAIHSEALQIWKEPYLSNFTEHGGPHILQVAKNLDSLTRNLQKCSNGLTPEEIFVLLSACSLHDIGMQQDLPDAREKHAQYAYELILHSHASVEGRERKVTLPIEGKNDRKAIALLARGHWTSFALTLEESAFIRDDNTVGRLRLLGTLLAMADLLDLSPIRGKHYRGPHRLTKLGGVSALHQGMHAVVEGCVIEASNSGVPSDLQYKVKWHQDDATVQYLSMWILSWFSTQWRQLAPELLRLSGGAIRWHNPWVEVQFGKEDGPPHVFPLEAKTYLRAEMEEQARINRDHFVNALRSGVEQRKREVYFLEGNSSSDLTHLEDWANYQARIMENVLAARLDVRAVDTADLASVVSELLTQWGGRLPECEDDDKAMEALQAWEKFPAGAFVTVLSAESEMRGPVEKVLEGLFNLSTGCGCICVVSGLRKNELRLPEGIDSRVFALAPFTKGELKTHLKSKLGFSDEKSQLLYNSKMGAFDKDSPAATYDYFIRNCGFQQSWDVH